MCLEIKNNFDINKLINTFIKNNIGNFKLQDNNLIKFRYEYILNNNDKNIFIYLNNWTQLLNLYNLIPESKRHFYEIINNKCKFFLDLDAKCQDFEIEEWNKHILHIKKELKNVFRDLFNKDINIIEYQSYPSEIERKYSCHLVVPDYSFYADDCKNLCNILLNTLDNKYTKIIDDKVYGIRRMLRLEGSTKINSTRIKVCINKNNIQEIINFSGLITNLENTELLITKLYNINKQISNKYLHQNNIILLKQYNKKYNFTIDDITFIKNNHKKIINKINIIHDSKRTIFILNYVIDNMLILKRISSCFCFDCKRIHEKQHPYIFVINRRLFFHCRRSPKPIDVSYILKEL